MYTDVWNQVAFADRLPLSPCKIPWVKIREQKSITLFIHRIATAVYKYLLYFKLVVGCILSAIKNEGKTSIS